MRAVWKSLVAGGFAFACLIPCPRAEAAKPSSRAKAPIRYRYIVDSRKSRVSFTFRGVLVPYDAHFGVLEGEVFLSPGNSFRGASGNILIKAASVKAKKPEQQRMLYSDVLEARRYPSIELRVSSVRPVGDPVGRRRRREKNWRLRARGVLKMHGAERKIPLSFQLADTGAELYIRGKGSLDLSDFGMSRPKVLLLVPGSDRVEVRVRLVASPAPR